jgi:TolB protein
VPLFGSYRWSPDGQTLALASGTPGDLFVVPVSGGIATNITNTPDVDESHLAWSADATRIAFTRRSNGGLPDVWVAASDGSGAVNLTPNSLTSIDLWPLWTADGQIVFSSSREGGGQKLFRVSASGGLPTRVSDHRIPASSDDGDLAMAVSPDQERVLFTRFTETGAQQQVGVVRLDGTEQVTFGDLAKSPSWSPCSQ